MLPVFRFTLTWLKVGGGGGPGGGGGGGIGILVNSGEVNSHLNLLHLVSAQKLCKVKELQPSDFHVQLQVNQETVVAKKNHLKVKNMTHHSDIH